MRLCPTQLQCVAQSMVYGWPPLQGFTSSRFPPWLAWQWDGFLSLCEDRGCAWDKELDPVLIFIPILCIVLRTSLMLSFVMAFSTDAITTSAFTWRGRRESQDQAVTREPHFLKSKQTKPPMSHFARACRHQLTHTLQMAINNRKKTVKTSPGWKTPPWTTRHFVFWLAVVIWWGFYKTRCSFVWATESHLRKAELSPAPWTPRASIPVNWSPPLTISCIYLGL